MTKRGNPIMVLANIEKRSVSTESLLKRLNDYGESYQSISRAVNPKLCVFVTYKSKATLKTLESNYDFLRIYPVKAHSWQIIRHIRGLKKFVCLEKTGPRLLIAGDPVFGFIIAFAVKLLTSNYHQLQVQFHGDIYLKPNKLNLRMYVRWALARFQILNSDSIRVVSKHQANEISRLIPVKRLNLVIAPIPINDFFYNSQLEKKEDSIGFVGRLHPERGVAQLREIISIVKEVFPEKKIYIIGEGPSRTHLEKAFRNDIAMKRILFLGWLNQEALLDALKKMNILLSTAPTEGYGLAIREAVMSGVQVLARDSGGARSAQIDFPESVFLFDDVEGAIKLISDRTKKEISRDAVLQFRKRQKSTDQTSISNLVNTWI